MIGIEEETQMYAAGFGGKGKCHRSRLLLLLAFCTALGTAALDPSGAPGLVFAADQDGIPEDAVLIPDISDRWAQDVTYSVMEREAAGCATQMKTVWWLSAAS